MGHHSPTDAQRSTLLSELERLLSDTIEMNRALRSIGAKARKSNHAFSRARRKFLRTKSKLKAIAFTRANSGYVEPWMSPHLNRVHKRKEAIFNSLVMRNSNSSGTTFLSDPFLPFLFWRNAELLANEQAAEHAVSRVAKCYWYKFDPIYEIAKWLYRRCVVKIMNESTLYSQSQFQLTPIIEREVLITESKIKEKIGQLEEAYQSIRISWRSTKVEQERLAERALELIRKATGRIHGMKSFGISVTDFQYGNSSALAELASVILALEEGLFRLSASRYTEDQNTKQVEHIGFPFHLKPDFSFVVPEDRRKGFMRDWLGMCRLFTSQDRIVYFGCRSLLEGILKCALSPILNKHEKEKEPLVITIGKSKTKKISVFRARKSLDILISAASQPAYGNLSGKSVGTARQICRLGNRHAHNAGLNFELDSATEIITGLAEMTNEIACNLRSN